MNLTRLQSTPEFWCPIYFNSVKPPSAVAVLIFKNIQTLENCVLFIRRSSSIRSHAGQIGFPGGRFENGDKSPADTALRETWEEVGLKPDKVKVLGGIEPMTSIDGSLVFPVIGETFESFDDLVINKTEVEAIFHAPIDYVLRNNRREFKFNMFGCWRRSFLYDCNSFSIWGLTAEILAKIDF